METRIERLEAQATTHAGSGGLTPHQAVMDICRKCGGSHLGADGSFKKCPYKNLTDGQARIAWKAHCALQFADAATT